MKIAVTGATGFIGRHVLAALKNTGEEVVTVSRHTGSVIMDIAKLSQDSYAQLGCPDVLIHLAWDGLPNYKSLHHFETELPKQYLCLKQLIESGLPKLVIAGTCFEYGMQSGALSADSILQPTNPYGYAKAALHQQLRFLQQTKSFQLSWARLFYLYGAGQAASSLYSQLQQAIARGDKTFNMSGGEQLRDFLPVEIAAQQLVQLALTDHNETVNICSGQAISVRRLVEQWCSEKNSDIHLKLGYYPYPDYEPMAFWGKKSLQENP